MKRALVLLFVISILGIFVAGCNEGSVQSSAAEQPGVEGKPEEKQVDDNHNTVGGMKAVTD
jgi:hypothetical protein